ncbi:hypothetical protein Emag_006268 [Eimeria magna]
MEGKQKGGRKRGRNGCQGSGIMSKFLDDSCAASSSPVSELRLSDSRERRMCPRSCATACCAAFWTTQDFTRAGCCISSSSSSSSKVDCNITDISSLASQSLFSELTESVGVAAVCMHPCRHASRLLPVDVCASPSLPDFVAAARRLCAQALPLSAVALGLERAEGAAEGTEAAEASAAEADGKQLASPLPGEGAADRAETETCESEAPSAGKTSDNNNNSSSNNNSNNNSSSSNNNNSDSSSSSGSSSSEGSAVDEGSRETWACAFSSRGFGTVKKEQVVEALAKLVGDRYKVNLMHARHTLLVEVNPGSG